jgi:hypothetical protein
VKNAKRWIYFSIMMMLMRDWGDSVIVMIRGDENINLCGDDVEQKMLPLRGNTGRSQIRQCDTVELST